LSASEFCYDLAINDFAFPQPATFNIQPATASDPRMNRRQFIFALVALAVIGSAGWVVRNRYKQSWTVREAKVGEKLLPNFRLNDVAAIHIKARIDLNIENKDGVWRVRERGNYPANYDHIKNLLVRIKDIKIVQSEEIGPSQRPRVELGEQGTGAGSGTLVEFRDAQGKVLDSLLVGKRHMRSETASDPFRMRGLFDGCYVLSPKEPANVLLISDELSGVSGEPGAWLNTEFCKIENVKSVSLTGTNAEILWTLSRESESKPWTLADGKPAEVLDTTKAAQTVEMLNFLGFVDVVSNAVAPENGFDKPMVVSIQTFDHFFYTLKISVPPKHGANYQVALGVRAEIASDRIARVDETPDEKKRVDEEFHANSKRLRDKLARESRFDSNGWNYVIESRLLEPLLCKRADLLEKTSIAEAKAGGQ
jgi:hypothetical protein